MTMARIGGIDRAGREAYWRKQIAACEASGKPIAGYCRDAGLSASKYHWWKAELKRRDAERGKAVLFAEVKAAEGAPLAWSSGIEVVLAGERVVRVARGFDGATLAAVVRVLEGLGC
jgi:hypothetical protein